MRVCEKYIRDKYEHKRFIAKTVPPKVERAAEDEPVAAPEPAATRRTSTGPALKPVAKRELPAPAPAAAPAPAVSLLDFDSEPVTPISPPIVQQQQQPQQQNAFGQQFTNFDEPPRPPAVSFSRLLSIFEVNVFVSCVD